MADVRALLKAKRQEVRVNHPLATYNASGQLRCLACGTLVKQSSSWDGHVGSKAHRTNAARLREEERRRVLEEQAREQEEARKRKAAEAEVDSGDEDEAIGPKRRKVDAHADGDESGEDDASSSRLASGRHATAGFPADFFSDPSRAPPPPPSDDESDEEVSAAAAVPPSAVDLEWQRFQEAVINAPDTRETYERATVMAEPVLAEEAPQGFPPLAGTEAAAPTEAVVHGAEARRRREQDDRELIMDRLLDEERAQEEADAKVTVLKSRLDAVKRQREAARRLKQKFADKQA